MDRFEQLERALRTSCPDLELRVMEPMARHTTFRIGGPARLMALPKTRDQAIAVVRAAAEREIAPFFMGNGSNLLVPDEGTERFVVKTADGLTGCSREGTEITADSGVTLAHLAVFAREQGLAGLEFAHGIPGTLGGAVTMNAGAYGGEMVQVVKRVTFLTEEGAVEDLDGAQCAFRFRHSVFSDERRLILGATLALAPDDPARIQARMEELMAKRKGKQPLEYPSAGSTFKRPEGYFAAALIDQCGLKGLTVGGAQVSEKHAGFVINRGGATCVDVLALVEQIKYRVREQTGVELELEVKILR